MYQLLTIIQTSRHFSGAVWRAVLRSPTTPTGAVAREPPVYTEERQFQSQQYEESRYYPPPDDYIERKGLQVHSPRANNIVIIMSDSL